jgi:hypothetical protein
MMLFPQESPEMAANPRCLFHDIPLLASISEIAQLLMIDIARRPQFDIDF